VLRELSLRRSRRSSENTSPRHRSAEARRHHLAKLPQTRVTPALINTFSKAYSLIFDSIALLCQTRSPYSILRFFLPLTGILQKDIDRASSFRQPLKSDCRRIHTLCLPNPPPSSEFEIGTEGHVTRRSAGARIPNHHSPSIARHQPRLHNAQH
jgi:hypothetical protein